MSWRSGVARIDPLLTGVGSWTPGESGDAITAEHRAHRDICRSRKPEHGTSSRCGVCRFRREQLLTMARPNIPSPGLPPALRYTLAAFHSTSTPPNAESPRRAVLLLRLRRTAPFDHALGALGPWGPYVQNPVAHGTRCPGPVEWVGRRHFLDGRRCGVAGATPVNCRWRAEAVRHPRSRFSCRLPRSYETADNEGRVAQWLPEHGVHEPPPAGSELAEPAVPPLELRFELAVWRTPVPARRASAGSPACMFS